MNIDKQEIDEIIKNAQSVVDYSNQISKLEGDRIAGFAKSILRILRKYKGIKEDTNMEVRDYVNLFEMARSDLEGVVEVVKSGDMDKAASMYISKAKTRGLDAKKLVAGLGSTFRTYSDLSSDEIKELKDKIKEKLSGEMPEKKSSKKKDKSEDEEDKMDTKEKTAKASTGKKVELIKKKKSEEMPEGPMPESAEFKGGKRMNIIDEILYRSGMFGDGQYMREQQSGTEGDASIAYGKRKGKKSSMGPRSSGGMNGKTTMEISGGNSARGKASRRAENEQETGYENEGLRKAPGTGEGGGDFGEIDDVRHPARGVGYTLGAKSGQRGGPPVSDPNMSGGGGVSGSKGRRGPADGSRENIDNEGLSGAPGLGDGQGDFGMRDDLHHPARGVGYTLGKKAFGRGQPPVSDPNTISGMKYTGRSEEGGGSRYTVPSEGRNARPESDVNTRTKGKYWKQGSK
jgi:hypothetical protein